MASTFRKTDPRPGVLAAEAAGLRWLAEAADGAPVVPALNDPAQDAYLLEPRLAPASATEAAAEAFGRALAHTHAAGAPWYGAPPPGVSGDGAMGDETLPLRQQGPAGDDSWGAFYAADRLAPYLRAARSNGSVDQEGERAIRRLCERLAAGDLDHPEPALVTERGHRTARIHGDLWSGNVLWTSDTAALARTSGVHQARAAGETVGVLIDPAAHGGQAESDLAQLFVFSAPYADRIVSAYHEVSPLAGGIQAAQERRGLHQLHILIVHAALFGGSYGAQAVRVARRYL